MNNQIFCVHSLIDGCDNFSFAGRKDQKEVIGLKGDSFKPMDIVDHICHPSTQGVDA